MFFNNCNWCRCWNKCEKRCCSNHCHKKDDYCKQQDRKCCHLEQSHNYCHKDYCNQPNNGYDRFENNNQGFNYNNYEDSDFRYYDQYGSFDKFDDNDYTCNKKHNHHDCKCSKKHHHDDYKCDKNDDEYGLGDYKHCKLDYDKCQPTKFVCFSVDKY